MSNFLIFKAAFNNSATPAIGTYTAEGATAQFNKNTSISPDYYLYNTADNTAVQWFVPTTETTDFEFVADILTRNWTNRVTYFIIADSTGTTRLRMWSQYSNWYFENSDSTGTSGNPEYIEVIDPTTSGGFGVFHQFRVRVRKLTASSSSVEVYVDGTLKLTATAGAALVTCAKIGFVGGAGTLAPGIDVGIQNTYLYDLSGGEVIDRGVLSGAFNRFISWAKSIFATQDNVVLRSGGNLMTGSKLGRPNDTGTFSISGGTTVGGTAGFVRCYGSSASTYPGAVEIGGDNIKFIFRNRAIESWSGNQDLGSSSRQFGTAYIKALNINGTAAGDILTHNASEFVNVTGAQTIAGDKDFTGTTGTHDVIPATTDTYDLGSSAKEYNNAYVKSLTVNGTAAGDILTHNASEFVPVSGGAVFSGYEVFRTANDGYIGFGGGTGWGNGAIIIAYGKDSSSRPGYVQLHCEDGANSIDMLLAPDGTATWGSKNLAMQEDVVPRSGGAVLDGQEYTRTVDNSTLNVYGGNGYGHGAFLQLTGKDDIGAGGFNIQAHNGSTNVVLNGKADGTLTWNGQSIQTVSDQRLKQQITEIDDKLLDAWQDVDLVQFKYNDAVDQKGDNARLHTGYVVQQIDKACKEHNVDISAYGLYCHEEYPEETEEVEVEQADGTKVKETRVIREANEHYSLRYTETLVVECKYLRRCIERLTARIEQLEKGKEQEADK